MTATFIGRARGVVIVCNHTTAPFRNADGETCFHEGPPCSARSSTGNVLRSVNRTYAVKNGWLDVVVADKQRDFCPEHAVWWQGYLDGRRAAADALKQKRASDKAVKRDAWLAKQREWKAKREEKAARSEAWHAKRAAKKAA